MTNPLIISQFRNKIILVIGDVMLDKYIFGTTTRISPEAPVPVISKKSESLSLGGAANVAKNLISLGVKTYLIGTFGNDDAGKKTRKLIREMGLDLKNMVTDRRKPTTLKTRLLSDGQQIARIDNEDDSKVSLSVENQILNRISKVIRIQKPDAVIISDYNKGLITPRLTNEIVKTARKFRVFVSVDPKGNDFRKYKGADLITPNKYEAESVTGIIIDNEEAKRKALRKLLKESGARSALITMGKQGVCYLNSKKGFNSVPANSIDVYDVTGAGDTFIAVFTLSLIISGSWDASSALANLASSLVISTVGTNSVSTSQLMKKLGDNQNNGSVVKLSELKKILGRLKRSGKKIVFTNGCFDLIHKGHLKLLSESKKLGDVLIVGLNSDSSVRRLKGRGRPVTGESERTTLIALIEEVDYVVQFGSLTPLSLIKQIKPDVLTKGGDYKKDEIVGSDFVENRGGKVKVIPLLSNHSTTYLLKKTRGS